MRLIINLSMLWYNYCLMTESHIGRTSQEFHADLNNNATYLQLGKEAKWYAQNAASYLEAFSQTGLLDVTSPRRIIEFGANEGASTIPLVQLARSNGSMLTSIELDNTHADHLANLGLILPEQVVNKDGVTYLEEMAERGEQYDLLAAFFFGPDTEGNLIKRLIPAALKARSKKSTFIATSDDYTITSMCNAFDKFEEKSGAPSRLIFKHF